MIDRKEKKRISKLVKYLERKYFNKDARGNSREYFEKLLQVPALELFVETGPKCNKECPHCYADCSPSKEGMFTPELLEAVMPQIDDTHIGKMPFTDGEPFLDPSNLMKILDIIDGFPIDLVTNADFADSYDNARDMLFELREHGFSLDFQKHRILNDVLTRSKLAPSIDEHRYQECYENVVNLAHAYCDVYKDQMDFKPETPFVIMYTIDSLDGYDIEKDEILAEKLFTPLEKRIKGLRIEINKDPELRNDHCYGATDDGLIQINIETLIPRGRARDMLKLKKKKYTPEDVPYVPRLQPSLTLHSDGDLYKGRVSCGVSQMKLGCIYDNTIKEMTDKLYDDPVYQLSRIADVKGIFTVLTWFGFDESLNGIDACDVCNQIFEYEDGNLIEELRDSLYGLLENRFKDVIELCYRVSIS